jgi:hypothetical protein
MGSVLRQKRAFLPVCGCVVEAFYLKAGVLISQRSFAVTRLDDDESA